MTGVRRMGKRIVLALEEELFLVLHLMRAGRLRWISRGGKPPGRITLATLEFNAVASSSGASDGGMLAFTEAGTRRRASLHLVAGETALAALDPGGLEVLTSSLAAFRDRLVLENHTLKRALTAPALFSGIGGAYADEILFRARLSPVTLTRSLEEAEIARLHDAVRTVLIEWTDRLRREANGEFPEQVTAFRPEMAVHGRFGKPCPECGAPIQRIVYAETETNYCARCQNSGRILADRALSRLLHKSWPKSLDDLD